MDRQQSRLSHLNQIKNTTPAPLSPFPLPTVNSVENNIAPPAEGPGSISPIPESRPLDANFSWNAIEEGEREDTDDLELNDHSCWSQLPYWARSLFKIIATVIIIGAPGLTSYFFYDDQITVFNIQVSFFFRSKIIF